MQSGGGRYIVHTGRRDGTVSLAKNVNLPAPSISVSNSINAFSKKGLSVVDMVYLLGNYFTFQTACEFYSTYIGHANYENFYYY